MYGALENLSVFVHVDTCKCWKSPKLYKINMETLFYFIFSLIMYNSMLIIIPLFVYTCTWCFRWPFGIFTELPRFCFTEMNKSRRNSAALFDSSCRFRTPLPLGFSGRNHVQKPSMNLFTLRHLAASCTCAAVKVGGIDLTGGKKTHVCTVTHWVYVNLIFFDVACFYLAPFIV